MPDITIATILVNAVDNRFDRVNLVRAHHQEFLLGRDQNHVFADHFSECTLGEELFGEVVQVSDFVVAPVRELIDRQELLVRIELEMLRIVIGEVLRIGTVADDKKLDETE